MVVLCVYIMVVCAHIMVVLLTQIGAKENHESSALSHWGGMARPLLDLIKDRK
jgi:hypothetical protein